MKVTERQSMEHLEGPSAAKAGSIKKKGQVSPKSISSEKISANELGSAKVNLSERAQDMKKIKSAVDAAPDADEAKIAKFKALINSGQYKVDSKAVADKMVDEHAYNDFLTNTEE